MAKITCAYSKCNIKFEPKRKWHIYHHPRCRKKAWDEKQSGLFEIKKRLNLLEKATADFKKITEKYKIKEK